MQIPKRSLWTDIAIVLVAAVVGLAVLPLIFADSTDPVQDVLWLVLAVITCVCLLLPTRSLADALADALISIPERRGLQTTWSRRTATELARLIVAAGYLLLLQAILRHPAVAVFGTSAEPFVIEAAIAAFAFLVLLVLLGSIYRAARPLVEGLAWTALDSLFATTRSEQATEAADTMRPVVTSTMAATPGSGATITRVTATENAITAGDAADETLPRSARVQG
jgi:hypothetical protein